MYVVYTSPDEIIVTTEADEEGALIQHFLGENRNLDDYDRTTSSDSAVFIRNNLQTR